jgi:hypothetical protein
MKNFKLILIFVGMIILSCKKTELPRMGTSERSFLDKGVVNKAQSNVIEGGACIGNFIDNMHSFINTWGIGSENYNNASQNPYFLTQRLEAHNAVYLAFNNCVNNLPPGTIYDPSFRQTPSIYMMPPADLETWLTFLVSNNLCNQNYVDEAKAFIAPLNAIIKRTVDDVGPSYYSTLYSSDDRFQMIVMHMFANESIYLDVSHAAGSNHRAYLYLKAASMLFTIPNVIANKLFDKPLAPVDPVDGGSPTPIIIEPWQGFIIDHTPAINIFNNYCVTSTPTIIYLPNPLPTTAILYYLTIEDAKNTIVDKSLDTQIFLNISDNKYYTNANFTTVVPNGYYKHPNDYSNNTYYHIVNGVITEVLTIIVDLEGPMEPE